MPTLSEGAATPILAPASTSASASASAPPLGNRQPSLTDTLLRIGYVILKIAIVLATVLRFAVYLTRSSQPQTADNGWHHSGTVARRDQLVGSGRIYLVQVGPHRDPYYVVELATWLRQKYALDVRVLDPIAVDSSATDSALHPFLGERLYAEIKREHPDLAADPHAYLIGFTDASMDSHLDPRSGLFSLRDNQRAAIISSAGMSIRGWHRWFQSNAALRQDDAQANDRLRRILLKDVGVLYWHLPLNADPGSLLYFNLNPNIANNDIYTSDIDPALYGWGAYFNDPCLVLTYSASAGLARLPETSRGALLRDCEQPESAEQPQTLLDTPASPPNTEQERMQLRLTYGQFTEKHTDFYLPGPVPIRLERALSNLYESPEAFGISGSHNYDRSLSSTDDMRHISISDADDGGVILQRTPAWLSTLMLAKWVDQSGMGSLLRWAGSPHGHFELTRGNGEVDSYLPCDDRTTCYLNGYRDPQGQTLIFDRDSLRKLLNLTAPGGNSLHFTYGLNSAAPRSITGILDSAGHRVSYSYNIRGQLSQVVYPSGESFNYTWDATQNLLAVATTPRPGASSISLVTNTYQSGRLVSQTLGDGGVYIYRYSPAGTGKIRNASVTTSDGTIFEVTFGPWGAAVRDRSSRDANQSAF